MARALILLLAVAAAANNQSWHVFKPEKGGTPVLGAPVACEGRGAPSFVPKLMLAKAGSEGARHPRDARHNGGIAGKKVDGSLPWATDVLRFSWHVAFPAAY